MKRNTRAKGTGFHQWLAGRPGLIRLENRNAPAIATEFSRLTGLLQVTSDASDAIVLRSDNDGRMLLNDVPIIINDILITEHVSRIEVTGGPGANLIDLSGIKSGQIARYHLTDVWPSKNINQAFDFSQVRNIVIRGGAGEDTITGSRYGDFIDGEGGSDSINAFRGDDLVGWDFADSVDGGPGDDIGLLSFDGMKIATPAINLAVNLDSNSITMVVDGQVKTVTGLEALDVEPGDSEVAGVTTTVTMSVISADPVDWNLPGMFADDNLAEATPFGRSGKPKEIVAPHGSAVDPLSQRLDILVPEAVTIR